MRGLWFKKTFCCLGVILGTVSQLRAADQQCVNAIKLYFQLGMMKSVGARALSEKIPNLEVYGFRNLAGADPKVAALLSLIERRRQLWDHLPQTPRDTSPVRDELNQWAKQNALPWKFAFPSDLNALHAYYVERGDLLPGDEMIEPRRSYINYRFYNLMLEDHILALSDPHDLITHVPSLAVAGFSEAMLHEARLYNRLTNFRMRSLGTDYRSHFGDELNLSLRALELKNSSRALTDPSTLQLDATSMILHDLAVGIREMTWETFSFVLPGPPARLVVHGNRSIFFSAAIGAGSGGDDDLVDALMGQPSSLPYETFPRFAEYIEASPQRFAKFLDSLHRIGHGNDPDHVKARLTKLIETCRLTYPNTFVDALAKGIQDDPILRLAFSAASKVALINDSLDFYEDYFNWIQKLPH